MSLESAKSPKPLFERGPRQFGRKSIEEEAGNERQRSGASEAVTRELVFTKCVG
jgi:hypothetical protein